MSRRERKKEETRENIMDYAIASFRKKGFSETSMEEIAEGADVSKGTLYNYFKDKESLLVGYFQKLVSGFEASIMETLKEHVDIETRLLNLMNLISEVTKNDKELALIYLKYRMQEPFDNAPASPQRSGMEKYVLGIIEKAQKEGQLKKDIPALVLTKNFHFLALSFIISSTKENQTPEIDNIKNQLIRMFLYGAKNQGSGEIL